MRKKWRVSARDRPRVAGATRMKGFGMVKELGLVARKTRKINVDWVASIEYMASEDHRYVRRSDVKADVQPRFES